MKKQHVSGRPALFSKRYRATSDLIVGWGSGICILILATYNQFQLGAVVWPTAPCLSIPELPTTHGLSNHESIDH
jgi:hypothetical protein